MADNHDTDRVFALAVDAYRHEWLSRRRGGDDQALADIANAYRLQRQASPPDLARLLLLAFHRDYLAGRNNSLPAELPRIWTLLGQPRRAIALARGITDGFSRAQALAQVAGALAMAGQTAAAERVAAEAEHVAESITIGSARAQALAQVSKALAAAGGLRRPCGSLQRRSGSPSRSPTTSRGRGR